MNADYASEDTYLTHLGGVVEEVVARHIDADLEVLSEEDNNGQLPLPLVQGCLMLLSTYYSNRENVAFAQGSEVPTSYNYLLDLYKDYAGGLDEQRIMLDEIKQRLAELEAYKEYDNNRTIEGEGLDVEVSGQTTTIDIETVDEGEY